MYTLSSIRNQKHLYFAWDKPWQRNIVELSEKNSDILSSDFPFHEFIGLYYEWLEAKEWTDRTRLFALMRDLHQQCGINKKSIVIGADSEMQAFGDYVLRIYYGRRITRAELQKIVLEDELDTSTLHIDPSALVATLPRIEIDTQKELVSKPAEPDICDKRTVAPARPRSSWVPSVVRKVIKTPTIDAPWTPIALWPYKWGSLIQPMPPESILHDFTKEQTEVNTLLNENWNDDENNLKGFGWAWAIPGGATWTKDRYYARISDGFITKALLNPHDTDKTILYWPPESENGIRKIYLLSSSKKVIGLISMSKDGNIIASKGEEMKKFPYTVPSPIRTNTQAVKWRIN